MHIPDYKIYKVNEHTPELIDLQQKLAAKVKIKAIEELKGDSMNLTLMLYLFLTFLPVTLVKIELQKRALHQMNS